MRKLLAVAVLVLTLATTWLFTGAAAPSAPPQAGGIYIHVLEPL